MSTELENELKEINLEEVDQLKKEDIQNPSKIAKVKRNPFEKIIDDSITICDELIEKNQAEVNVDKLIKTFEKEILKKEEFYNLVKLYEKTKKMKEDQINLEDSKIKGDFNDIKSSLHNIKNSYENKKKTLNKNKSEDKEKDEKSEQPSKKKKTTNKKNTEILDVSNIVSKLSKIEENDENLEKEKIEECKTPVKEPEPIKIQEKAEEENYLKSPAQNKNPDLNDNKNNSVETTILKISVTKDTSAKKPKNDNNNTSIMNFFKPRAGSSIPNSAAHSIIKQKKYIEDIPKSKDFDNIVMDLEQTENEAKINITNFDVNQSTNLSKSLFIVKHQSSNLSTLEYQIDNCDPSSSQKKSKFYGIKGNEINNVSEYQVSLKNYLEEISNTRKKQINKTKVLKRKVIFIHDSFLQYRKIPDKTSKLINPRNPFKKDEYLIDYDKDSEEEFLEENAEDIKSNDNSADEEEIPEDEEEDAIKWIVPDGHLSEDEVSQKEDLEKNDYLKKKKSVMEILEIRKNYAKPVIVNFNLAINSTDNRIKSLQNLCKARIFNLNSNINDTNILNAEENIEKNQDHENINIIFKSKSNIENENFPIKITSKKSEETGRRTGMNNNIKDKLEDLVREIHLSYMTKEYLIKVITDKFNDISKKSLSNFFKDSVLKVKCKNSLRKQWLVKKEILESANFISSEYNQLLEKQSAIFEEKEKEKKKEIEENQINNQNLLNEQRGLTFTNFDLNAVNNFNLNNLNYNQSFPMRNLQIPSLIDNNIPILNNQFNIQNYNVNLNINNDDPMNNIMNTKEKTKAKRIKKEKGSPTKSKNKSGVKLNKSSKKDNKNNTTNDKKFDLSSFTLFSGRPDLKKKDSFNL